MLGVGGIVAVVTESLAVLLFLLAVVLVVVGAVYAWQQKQKRREDLAAWAFQHGLTFSHDDQHRLDRLELHLFSLGDGRGCENVVSGTWQDRPVHLADYWYYDEDHDNEGGTSRTYHRFSIGLTKVDAWLPPVRIGHETALSRLGDKLGFGDVDFESEAFNRKFRVKAADREFAYKLLDARMLGWLLTTAGGHCYEVSGQWLLVHCKRLPPGKLTTLLYAAKGFVDQIPRLVWTDYGTDGKVTS